MLKPIWGLSFTEERQRAGGRKYIFYPLPQGLRATKFIYAKQKICILRRTAQKIRLG